MLQGNQPVNDLLGKGQGEQTPIISNPRFYLLLKSVHDQRKSTESEVGERGRGVNEDVRSSGV